MSSLVKTNLPGWRCQTPEDRWRSARQEPHRELSRARMTWTSTRKHHILVLRHCYTDINMYYILVADAAVTQK